MQKIDDKILFGSSVKAWRNHLGISQETLAERADLHRTYVSDVERGARNLSLESITRLARALNVSVAALFPASLAKERTNGQSRESVDILLVDDNPDDVEMTLRAFKQARFANRIQVVGDGQEALDFLFCRGKNARRRTPGRAQMVLLDLNLPKVSGLEVLRQLKADKRTAAIPVVILTVFDDNYSVAECRRLGADSYLVKPVNFQRLSEATPRLKLNWALVRPPETANGKVAVKFFPGGGFSKKGFQQTGDGQMRSQV